MKTKKRAIEQIVHEQVQKWEIMRGKERKGETVITLITVSREPGSGGRFVAQELAAELELDLFHGEIVQELAKSADMSNKLLETLDEKAISLLDDWIATLVDRRHLWPDQYLQHLMKVIGTIGEHGRAVIVGRGANFILPPAGKFSVRIVAPFEARIQNVAKDFSVSVEEAKRRVLRAESDRRAFVRKYFHGDIADPTNYDLVINTGRLSVNKAVEIIIKALGR